MSRQHTCADQEPELSLLLDGRLDAATARRLRRHLIDCPGCLAELEGLQRARSLIRSLPVREVPAGLFTQSELQPTSSPASPELQGRTRPGSEVSAAAPRGRSWAGLVAVAAMIVGLAMTVGGGDLIQPAVVDFDRLSAGHTSLARGAGVPMPVALWPDAGATAAPVTGTSDPATDDGSAMLAAAAMRGSGVPLAGETLVVAWPDGPDRPAVVTVATVSVAAHPAQQVTDPGEKYEISVGEVEHIMDRRCIRVDLRLADGRQLQEQVWIDESSGVFLRRVTFEDGERARSVSYQSLDLDADVAAAVADDAMSATTLREPAQVDALRAAGWDIPASLPGGYELLGAAVHSGVSGMPVQAMYSDGLYMASLFLQPGQPDLTLIAGSATHVDELPDRLAYVWNGLPNRMIWSASDRTYTLVGDAPTDDMTEMAAGLPAD